MRPLCATLLDVSLGLAVTLGCEGPRVGSPLEQEPLDKCDEFCAAGVGCDRDCVHACAIGVTLCRAEWMQALGCAAQAPGCDRSFALPFSPACEDDFARADACAPQAACAAEESTELCQGCCASWEPEGALVWQSAFRDCACEACSSECGVNYCGVETGSPLACDSCAAAFCTDDVAQACAADPGCYRYDVCVAGCPRDDSSHCSEHASFSACRACCVREFTEGAERHDEVLVECACGSCREHCLDSEVCEGFDIIRPACEWCLDTTCSVVLDRTCGAEARCSSFMACTAACPS